MEEIKTYTLADFLKTLKNNIAFLFTQWKKIFIVGFVFALIGIGYRWWRGPVYKAEMSFVAENGGGDKLGGYAGLAAQFGVDLGQGGGAFEGENLLEVFKSRKMVVKTLLTPSEPNNATRLLIHDYIENHKLNSGASKKQFFDTLNFSNFPIPNRRRDSVLNKVYEKIVKSQLVVEKKDKKLNFVYLDMEDGNEFFAKRFSEALSNNTIEYYTKYKTKKSKFNVDLMQSQADSLKRLLTGNIVDIAELNDLNVNPNKQILKTSSQKKQIDVQANTAMYVEVLKQLALAKITLMRETPLIQIIDEPIFPLRKVNFGYLLTTLLFSVIGAVIYIAYLLLVLKTSSSKPNE
jgi:hypothetical protein